MAAGSTSIKKGNVVPPKAGEQTLLGGEKRTPDRIGVAKAVVKGQRGSGRVEVALKADPFDSAAKADAFDSAPNKPWFFSPTPGVRSETEAQSGGHLRLGAEVDAAADWSSLASASASAQASADLLSFGFSEKEQKTEHFWNGDQLKKTVEYNGSFDFGLNGSAAIDRGGVGAHLGAGALVNLSSVAGSLETSSGDGIVQAGLGGRVGLALGVAGDLDVSVRKDNLGFSADLDVGPIGGHIALSVNPEKILEKLTRE